ncbi:MAG: metal ABC transporter permease [Alphaproteobacteria bacterium]|nr:metal ABC transporter permease [Alphaproteobacteria bacterium]
MVDILGPAIAAGLMIAMTHAPLGIEVLKRGIIFIDLAIAQIAGLGLVVANVTMPAAPWWALQGAALSFAVLAALFFRAVERKAPQHQEAVIGCAFVLAASLALLLLADRPHGGEEIQHLLSGQILFVTWANVFAHMPVYAAILALWFVAPSLRGGLGFYLLFALAVTSSVQLVGVYVVFASLILPALAACGARQAHRTAWTCGILAVLSGITASACFDLPAGPALVMAYLAVCVAVRGAGKITAR